MVVYEKNMGSFSHFWSCYDFLNVENFSYIFLCLMNIKHIGILSRRKTQCRLDDIK